jgi:hypothetical protein
MARTITDSFEDLCAGGLPVTVATALSALLDATKSAVAEAVDTKQVVDALSSNTRNFTYWARLKQEERTAREAAAAEVAADLAAVDQNEEHEIAPVTSAVLGDISSPYVSPSATADAGPVFDYGTVYDEEELEESEVYDEEERHPIDLVATVEGVLTNAQLTDLFETSIIPTLAEALGAYEVTDTAVQSQTIAVVNLAARSDTEPYIYGLPSGTIVSEHSTTVEGAVVTVEIVIAGEIDPENPPVDPVEAVNAAIAESEAEEPTDAPTGIVIEFSRPDGIALSDGDLTAPIAEARQSLSSLLGDVLVDSIEPTLDGARRVHFALGGGGNLDVRATRLASVQFRGTKSFAGVGVFAEAAGTY